MITDEYLEMIEGSVEPLKNILPKESKLLFASFFKHNSIQDMDSEEIMDGITNGTSVSAGSYVECYQLVSISKKNTNTHEPLKKELVLEVPEFTDVPQNMRTTVLKEWLQSHDENNEYFCDSFTEEILPDGWRVFVPNRAPECFDAPDDDYAFIAVT